MNEILNKVKSIAVAVAIIVIAGLIENIGLFLILVFKIQNKFMFSSLFCVTTVLSFVLIPYLIIKKINLLNYHPKFNVKQFLLLAIIILLINVILYSSKNIDHDFIVAFSEELLFRWLVFSVLLNDFNKTESMLIGSVLFAVLLHINGSFMINILLKFPISFILYKLSDKYGLQWAISIHWLYNSSISYISN